MRRPGGPVSILALAGAFFLLIWSGPRLKVPDATPAASQDYCGELSSQLQFTLQPTGPTCCWKLSVENNLSTIFSLRPTLTLTANFPFMGMTLAPGWAFASPPTFPTPGPITLNYTAGSSIPSGTTTIGTFCLNFFNNTTGTLTIQWMVGGPAGDFTCSTTLNLTCPQGCWLCGMKCEDLNQNGKCDGGDPRLPNWTITLTDSQGNTVTTKTDQWGQYCFSNIAPGGPYTISEDVPSGWQAEPLHCFKSIPIPGNQPEFLSCGAGTCTFTCNYRQDIDRYDCIMCSFPNVRAAAEARECADRPQILNTGWNERLLSPIPLSDPDDEWVVLQDPDPSTQEPRPATVISNPQTKKQPQSEWISADQLGRVRRTGQYVFQRCFCLDPDDLPKASGKITLWAADEAIVFLNGKQIGVTPPRSYQQPDPLTIPLSDFRAGLNCLQVVVTGGPTSFLPGLGLGPQAGFNLVGDVTAGSDLCCEGGTICGVTFEDVNGDGVMDSRDRPLPGWTIILRDDQGTVVRTALTDQNGAYCFFDLPPGRYVVSEVLQPGWKQTAPPAPGTHTVDLQPKENVRHRDFGNRRP
jgi:hypothetical protein